MFHHAAMMPGFGGLGSMVRGIDGSGIGAAGSTVLRVDGLRTTDHERSSDRAIVLAEEPRLPLANRQLPLVNHVLARAVDASKRVAQRARVPVALTSAATLAGCGMGDGDFSGSDQLASASFMTVVVLGFVIGAGVLGVRAMTSSNTTFAEKVSGLSDKQVDRGFRKRAALLDHPKKREDAYQGLIALVNDRPQALIREHLDLIFERANIVKETEELSVLINFMQQRPDLFEYEDVEKMINWAKGSDDVILRARFVDALFKGTIVSDRVLGIKLSENFGLRENGLAPIMQQRRMTLKLKELLDSIKYDGTTRDEDPWKMQERLGKLITLSLSEDERGRLTQEIFEKGKPWLTVWLKNGDPEPQKGRHVRLVIDDLQKLVCEKPANELLIEDRVKALIWLMSVAQEGFSYREVYDILIIWDLLMGPDDLANGHYKKGVEGLNALIEKRALVDPSVLDNLILTVSTGRHEFIPTLVKAYAISPSLFMSYHVDVLLKVAAVANSAELTQLLGQMLIDLQPGSTLPSSVRGGDLLASLSAQAVGAFWFSYAMETRAIMQFRMDMLGDSRPQRVFLYFLERIEKESVGTRFILAEQIFVPLLKAYPEMLIQAVKDKFKEKIEEHELQDDEAVALLAEAMAEAELIRTAAQVDRVLEEIEG